MRRERFTWNKNKRIANFEKHGIDFNEALTVFDDPYALYEYDAEHSQYEERFTALGVSEKDNLLIVCHCYRDEDVIRIISARKANILEQQEYGGMLT